jgi:hypothetical protein
MPPKKHLFNSLHFAFTGKLSMTRTELMAFVAKHGGSFHSTVNKSVTLLVASRSEYEGNSTKVRIDKRCAWMLNTTKQALQAKAFDIPVVKEKFMHACVKKQKLLPFDDYLWEVLRGVAVCMHRLMCLSHSVSKGRGIGF